MLAQLEDERIVNRDGACVVERISRGLKLNGFHNDNQTCFAFDILDPDADGVRKIIIHDHFGNADTAMEGELYVKSSGPIRTVCMIRYIILEGTITEIRFVPNH